MNDILILKLINFLKRIWGNFCKTTDKTDGFNIFFTLIVLALFIWSFFWSYNIFTIIIHFVIFIILIFTLILNFSGE
jgi:cobalamin biosynthesis protein CobD/CbiB